MWSLVAGLGGLSALVGVGILVAVTATTGGSRKLPPIELLEFTHPVTGARMVKPTFKMTAYQVEHIIRTCDGKLRDS